MLNAISNTSPLLYLYRIEAIEFLPKLFGKILIPMAIVDELEVGKKKGFDVPHVKEYKWLRIENPRNMPSEWLSLDLGPGELSVLALAFEKKDYIVLLDDSLARRTAKTAGLRVWGTLRILLEAKSKGMIKKIEPYVQRLSKSGMWLSDEIRQRILNLAGE